jgi:hypothetical protein
VSRTRSVKSSNPQGSLRGLGQGAADDFFGKRRVEMEGNDTFLVESEKAEIILANISSSIPHQKWANMVAVLMKKTNWSRLGDLAKVLSKVPEDIAAMFDVYEKEKGLTIDDDVRLKYYKDFTRAALGASVLHFDDVSCICRVVGSCLIARFCSMLQF